MVARAKHRTVQDAKRVPRKRPASPSPPPLRQAGRQRAHGVGGGPVAPGASPGVAPIAAALAGAPYAVARHSITLSSFCLSFV